VDGRQYGLFEWRGSPIAARLAELEAEERVTARFGGQVELMGYERLVQGEVAPGGRVELVTYWRVVGRPAEDLAIFVHLVDDAGRLIGQHDGLDVQIGNTRVGDEVAQYHRIELPPDLAAGRYGLRLGVYGRESLARLPLEEGGDFLELRPVVAP
jgi:hypothetical protein